MVTCEKKLLRHTCAKRKEGGYKKMKKELDTGSTHSKDSTNLVQVPKKKRRMRILSGHPIIMLLLNLVPLLVMFILYILSDT